MTNLTWGFELVAVVAALVVCFILLRSLFFRRGSRGNVPSPEEVKSSLERMDDEARRTIALLMAKFTLSLSPEAFSMLCVATALAIKQPLGRLTQKVVLTEFLDSLNTVQFVMLLEDLYEIEIPDEDAEKVLTFEDILRYVNSRLVSA